jgi:hypothetical protein
VSYIPRSGDIDLRCPAEGCRDTEHYAMVSQCGNCGARARGIFTRGHRLPPLAGCPEFWAIPATERPDEIPCAPEPECVACGCEAAGWKGLA